MKTKTTILTIVLLISVNLSAQNPINPLDSRVSVNAQEQKLSKVLKALEQQGEFTLAYSADVISADRLITYQVDDVALRTVLTHLFKASQIQFKAQGEKVLLFSKAPAATGLIQTVRGTIVDSESKQPIIGGNIFIPGSDPLIGASTDVFGRFKMEKVPVGRHDFQVRFMGYKTKTLSNLSIDAGKEVVLTIGMEESVTELNEVVVTSEIDKSVPLNEMALVSAKSFSVEETSKYAGSFNDPARMASSFAGVVGSTDDTENAIIIRGNSPRGLLWRLEGLEVSNPNHFASDGASSGAISMLNSNVLANSDFMTGAFPAEYGNAFSGVFDLKLRNGNNETREYAIQAGLLGLDASFEGPIKRKEGVNLPNASYLLNYRYSTISLIEAMGLDIAGEGEKVPAFQDLAFKVNIPTLKTGTFSIYGLGGGSKTDALNQTEINGEIYSGSEIEKYKMGLVGISNIYSINNNTYLETNLSYSTTQYDFLFENAYLNPDNNEVELFEEDVEDYENTALRIASTFSTKINARHSTKYGFVYSLLKHNLKSLGRLNPTEIDYKSNDQGNMGMFQGFVSHKVNINDQFAVTGGLHYLRLNLDGQQNLEPRFGLRWKFKANQSLSFGFGLHSRREESSLYYTELAMGDGSFYQPNTKLDLAKARHFVVGYDRNIGQNLYLKLEAYYQDLYNIPISDDPTSDYSSLNQDNAYQRLALINEGTGENYGLELTLEKFMTNGFFFMMTGSLYESKYETLTGITYDTRFNGNYNASLVAGKEFKLGNTMKSKVLNVGIETVFAGGARSYEIDLEASRLAGETVFAPNSAFANQLQAYQRIDFQIGLKTNKKKTTHELKLDIQNVTSSLNVVAERYNPSTQQIENVGFTGELIPVLSYKIIF